MTFKERIDTVTNQLICLQDYVNRQCLK
ncbi:TPA: hypothetical protein OUJ12_000029 [Citrobacter braakii]|nr:hypothetical protein [Citrobacter braakii]